jgi:hypothetical protein
MEHIKFKRNRKKKATKENKKKKATKIHINL